MPRDLPIILPIIPLDNPDTIIDDRIQLVFVQGEMLEFVGEGEGVDE
jgi:hypothetical protein